MGNEWEFQYAMGRQQSIFPWSDLVSLVLRHVRKMPTPQRPLRVLELGFGAGANIPLFNENTFGREIEYFGIEGSETAVSEVRLKFPEIPSDHLLAGAFTKDWPCSGPFDLIFDRAAAYCVDCSEYQRLVNQIETNLEPGGFYIGVDWYSQEHSDFFGGRERSAHSRDKFTSGQFTDLGLVHFSTETEIRNLFSNFEFLSFTHKKTEDLLTAKVLAEYSFVAKYSEKPDQD